MVEQAQIVGPSGDVVEVEDGQVLALERDEFEAAMEAGLAFSWSSATYDYAASDTILGVQNDSDLYDLVIKRVMVTGDTATEFIAHTSSGVTMAGTAVTGVSLNRSSAITAPATAKANETGNGQAAASYSGRVLSGRIAANGIANIDNVGLVLPKSHNFGVDLVADGTGANVTVIGYFRPKA